MTGDEWLSKRSTEELFKLRRELLHNCREGSEAPRVRARVTTIDAILASRKFRLLNFMDRLDGKDAPDD